MKEKSGQSNIFSFGENALTKLKETTTVREYEFVEPLRKCSVCGLLKPLTEYPRRKTKGRIKKYKRECKECCAQRARKWTKDNPEKAREQSRKWYEENSEKAREQSRKWRKDNPEKSGKWQKDNPEKVRGNYRKWAKANLEKRRENYVLCSMYGRRRAGDTNGTGICMLCGEMDSRLLEVHHLFPNCGFVVNLCSNCHRKHRASTQEVHMQTVQNAIEKTPFLWHDVGLPARGYKGEPK